MLKSDCRASLFLSLLILEEDKSMQKVAIYCRLSEEDKNKKCENIDSESIQNQKTMLCEYALEKGWEIYNIYSDDDYAGADRKRPQFNKLLEDAKDKKFDIVLCKTQSRFTRELELVEKYIHGLFPIWNIRFVSIVDNADTANKGNKKSRQINGLVNEWYLEDMSENIKSVLTNKRKSGIHIGAFALYGYKKDPNKKGHLIIDEDTANVVREVFTLFSKGYGKTAIARILNEKGIPNPTEYKRLKGLRYKQPTRKNSTLWKYFAISNMLTNEIYIGNMVQGKYGSISYKTKQNKPRPKDEWFIVKGTHEAIIEKELWNKVQDMIKNRYKPFKSGTIGLFAGKVKCMHCGYTMRSSKSHDKYYLKCSNRHISKNACIGSFISVEKLENVVLNELKKMSDEFLDKENLEKGVILCDSLKNQKENLEKEISAYKKKTAEYSKATKDLYFDKVKGIITEAEYIEFSKEFAEKKKQAENILLGLKEDIEKIAERINNDDNRHKIIEEYTNIKRLNREIVQKLIDHICVGKKIGGSKEVPIEVHWNF